LFHCFRPQFDFDESSPKKVSQKGKSTSKNETIPDDARKYQIGCNPCIHQGLTTTDDSREFGRKVPFGISKAVLSTTQPPHQNVCIERVAGSFCTEPAIPRSCRMASATIRAFTLRGFPSAASKCFARLCVPPWLFGLHLFGQCQNGVGKSARKSILLTFRIKIGGKTTLNFRFLGDPKRCPKMKTV
jgi:hypothetical protein